MNNILFWGGILAVVVYTGTVILGGILRPGYSHVSNFISDLIATGSPNKSILDPLFLVFNLLTGVFAVGLWVFVRAQNAGAGALGTIGAVVLMLEALAGFATVFYPEDAPGSAMTSIGKTHIALAGLSSLTTMINMLLIGLWLRGIPGMAGFSVYSIISVIVVFITGGLTAVSGAKNSPVRGLLERLTIGSFLQWMLVIGVKLLM